jgi:hypothetical protein
MDIPTVPPVVNDPEEVAARAVAEMIRKKSEAGELLRQDELAQGMLERTLLPAENVERKRRLDAVVEKALDGNADLVKLHAEEREPHYFSTQFMTEAYARILVGKESDPLLLIADIVRENSAVYPRPVPVAMFTGSPFDLSRKEIQACLERMAGQEEYNDIRQTETSIGNVFLYSTSHLEPNYASMLAEWLDVGQANNP